MMQLVQTWHYQGELTLVTAKNISYDEPASKGKPHHFAKLLLFSIHLLYHQSKSSYSYCMQVGVLSIERVLKGEKVQVCSGLYYSTNSWLDTGVFEFHPSLSTWIPQRKIEFFWIDFNCDVESSSKKQLGNLGQSDYRSENLQNRTILPQVL